MLIPPMGKGPRLCLFAPSRTQKGNQESLRELQTENLLERDTQTWYTG